MLFLSVVDVILVSGETEQRALGVVGEGSVVTCHRPGCQTVTCHRVLSKEVQAHVYFYRAILLTPSACV